MFECEMPYADCAVEPLLVARVALGPHHLHASDAAGEIQRPLQREPLDKMPRGVNVELEL